MHTDNMLENNKKSVGTSDSGAAFYNSVKRVCDIFLSIFALIVLFPFLVIVCICIAADDFGSPFFIQDRVGKDGKVFRMLKFRTMRMNAEDEKKFLEEHNENSGVHFKIKNDPRITRVGKLLRRTSVDELPQLINIIRGEMSIVGPRPFIPEEQSKLPDDRLTVLPGLSCYWQIADRTVLSDEEQLELDYKYIRERSLFIDFKIICRTLGVILRNKNC